MKRIFTLLAMIGAYVGVTNAQATVESATPREKVVFANEVKTEKAPTVINDAQIKAEKAAQRKEHNTIEFNATLNGSLSHFNNSWQTVNGTTNTITGVGNNGRRGFDSHYALRDEQGRRIPSDSQSALSSQRRRINRQRD